VPSRNKNTTGIVGALYSGPIPSAAEMAKYEELSPGAASRLIRLMEQQAQHRQDLEAIVIRRNLQDQRLGVIFAFIIVISSLIVATICVYWGHVVVGALIGTSGIGSIITAFIYGTRSNRAERENKIQR